MRPCVATLWLSLLTVIIPTTAATANVNNIPIDGRLCCDRILLLLIVLDIIFKMKEEEVVADIMSTGTSLEMG